VSVTTSKHIHFAVAKRQSTLHGRASRQVIKMHYYLTVTQVCVAGGNELLLLLLLLMVVVVHG